MTSALLASALDEVHSSTAIGAPKQKEMIRMQAQRYQRGSLTLQQRKTQPDLWVFRHYEDVGGKRTYRKQSIGTILEFPTRKDADEFQSLVRALNPRERVMVLLAGSTGLRRGELIALRWRDIDWKQQQASVTHSIWRTVEGDCKTEASRKPVPLHPVVLGELQQWRMSSMYREEDDFIFAGVRNNGRNPITPDMVLKQRIRPVLIDLGITKTIGWHSFRHGYATMLRQNGVDLKTAQELMRHANPSTTLDIYQQAVSEEKRVAQGLACASLFGEVPLQHPSTPSEGH